MDALQQAPAIDEPGIIRLDPRATYDLSALARAMGVHPRTINRRRKDKRGRFPKPFLLGNKPHWRGAVVNAWMDNRQQEAMS